MAIKWPVCFRSIFHIMYHYQEVNYSSFAKLPNGYDLHDVSFMDLNRDKKDSTLGLFQK